MQTSHILLATVVAAGGIGLFVANTENEKIKKLIGKGKKEPEKVPVKTTTNTNVSAYNPANGISSRSPKSDIMRLQNALIAAGHLAPTQTTKSGASVSSADGIWGSMTTTAVSKAGLSSPISESQLSSIKKNNSSSNPFDWGGSSENTQTNAEIAHFIGNEMASRISIDYEAIYNKIKNKTNSDIKAIDVLYRKDYGVKGLLKDMQLSKDGGLVDFDSINAKAIRSLLSRAGLSGLGSLGEVRTRTNTTIMDENNGDVVVGKNLVLGRIIQSNGDKTLIQTIDGHRVIANTNDLVNHY